jgi:hypothetical protein
MQKNEYIDHPKCTFRMVPQKKKSRGSFLTPPDEGEEFELTEISHPHLE